MRNSQLTNTANRNSPSKPQTIQMQNMPSNKQQIQQPMVNQNQTQYYYDQKRPAFWYFGSWMLFLVAVAVNVGVWALNFYIFGSQASHFYERAYATSIYIDGSLYTDSTAIFTNYRYPPNSAGPTAFSIIFSWLLWKLPLIIYLTNLIEQQQSLARKGLSIIITIMILLAADILLTIFSPQNYYQGIYYALNALLTLVIAIINAPQQKTKQAILNAIIPLFVILMLYLIYALFLPSIYGVYIRDLPSISAIYLIVYLYPAFQLLIYGGVLFIGKWVQAERGVKDFYGQIHFMMLGYGVGIILLCGYTQVQFYFLIAYFIFKNIFFNWLLKDQKDNLVSNPPCLPGWIIMYYLSYLLNFIPLIAVGKVVVSKSFFSQLFNIAVSMLYSINNPLYPHSTYSSSNINTSFSGNIYWLAALIVWLGLTFTQKYSRRKPLWRDIFYNLFGIHLFFLGIVSALQLNNLRLNSL